MSDILPKLPPGPSEQVQKPSATTNDVDAFVYGVGGTLLIGSQLISKTAPKFAGKVTENIVGPEIALGAAKKFTYPPLKRPFLLAPAPFGFAEPQAFGLAPNYMYDFESRLKSHPILGGRGLEKLLPPPSEFLKNLPDNDPRVIYANFEERGVEQRRELEKLTPGASVEELLGLYTLAKGPNAKQVFYFPEDIAKSLEVSVRSKVGFEQGTKLLEDALIQPGTELNLPAPNTQPTTVPSPFDQSPPSFVVPQSTADLFAQLQAEGVKRPLDDPPTNTLQQAAFAIANDVVKQLASERADP
jgi:hypothetical protein